MCISKSFQTSVLKPDPGKWDQIQEKINDLAEKRRMALEVKDKKVQPARFSERRHSILDHMHHGDGRIVIFVICLCACLCSFCFVLDLAHTHI